MSDLVFELRLPLDDRVYELLRTVDEFEVERNGAALIVRTPVHRGGPHALMDARLFIDDVEDYLTDGDAYVSEFELAMTRR